MAQAKETLISKPLEAYSSFVFKSAEETKNLIQTRSWLLSLFRVVIPCYSVLKSEFDAPKIQDICQLASNALKNSNNEELMRAGLESVGDLVRNFPESMAPHVPGLLDYMMETLQNSNTAKDLKICIISTTGDIALGCPTEIKSRLERILRIFLLAFEAVVHMINTEVGGGLTRPTAQVWSTPTRCERPWLSRSTI